MKSSLNMLDFIFGKQTKKIFHQLIAIISFYIFKHLKINLTLPQSRTYKKNYNTKVLIPSPHFTTYIKTSYYRHSKPCNGVHYTNILLFICNQRKILHLNLKQILVTNIYSTKFKVCIIDPS